MKKLPVTLGDLKLGAARTCPRGYILRKGYTRKDGTKVTSGCTPDTGKPGKTPPSERILPKPEKGKLGGWKKNLSARTRREILRSVAQKDGCSTVGKRLQLLKNLTADAGTKRVAEADRKWLKRQGFCARERKG